MSEYIPIYEYCKKHNVSKQNVYRWIREQKILPEQVKKETVTVERMRIKEDAIPL